MGLGLSSGLIKDRNSSGTTSDGQPSVGAQAGFEVKEALDQASVGKLWFTRRFAIGPGLALQAKGRIQWSHKAGETFRYPLGEKG
jgi:hypothetical protein